MIIADLLTTVRPRLEKDGSPRFADYILNWYNTAGVFVTVVQSRSGFNILTAKLFNWNFILLEVVSRRRDPQLQLSENYSDLIKCRSTIL